MKLFGSGSKEEELESKEPKSGPRRGRGGSSRHVYRDHQGRIRERDGVVTGGKDKDKRFTGEIEKPYLVPGSEEAEAERKARLKSSAVGLLRDVTIAVIIMLIIIGTLWAYTGNWPPMVVVESSSMMHGEDSDVGVIDTGDLVLVKKTEGKKDITTYFEGKNKDYKTYGDYGDVIIYEKDGINPDEAADMGLNPDFYTPVIHRVILWLEYDEEDNNFNIPELNLYDLPLDGTVTVDMNFHAHNVNDEDGPLTLDLEDIKNRMGNDIHSGFITHGDNNPREAIDQLGTSSPVKPDWVIGKAKGEMPWFGLIKLYISGNINDRNPAPPSSVNMLIFTIALLIVIPIAADIGYSYYMKRKGSDEDDEPEEEEETGRPGGPPRGPRSGGGMQRFKERG